MRIQVSVADDMVEKLDKIAHEMGISRSALCSVYIGQGALSHEKAYSLAQDLAFQLGSQLADQVPAAKKPKK